MMLMVCIRLDRLDDGMSRHRMHQSPATLVVPLPCHLVLALPVLTRLLLATQLLNRTPQINKLPLLKFGDWNEGWAYDEDPPTCIHYSIDWN